jgi:hypothetical protein
MDVLHHGMVHFGRLEVLPQGEDLTTAGDQVVHCVKNLFARLSESKHQSRFGMLSKVADALQLLQASRVPRLRSYLPVKPFDGLHVVGNDFLACADHAFQRAPGALDVRDQGFNGRLWTALFDGDHRLVPDLCSAIGQFVAVDGSDYGVADLHQKNGLCNAIGFAFVILNRSSGFHCTKTTGTRANIAEDHKRRRARTPAFPHIRAVTALANGVQFVLIDQLPHMPVVFAHGQFNAQPIRLSGAGLGPLYDIEFDHMAKIVSWGSSV